MATRPNFMAELGDRLFSLFNRDGHIDEAEAALMTDLDTYGHQVDAFASVLRFGQAPRYIERLDPDWLPRVAD